MTIRDGLGQILTQSLPPACHFAPPSGDDERSRHKKRVGHVTILVSMADEDAWFLEDVRPFEGPFVPLSVRRIAVTHPLDPPTFRFCIL